ncbi:MAG: hypothetical protein WEB30_10920 [Cyclobacteriaceae bacterium]
MSNKKRFLRLESIASYLQTERDGDEIFIKHKDKIVAPADGKFIKMSKDPVRLEIEIELDKNEKWVELELWDYDHFSPNDSLGMFKLLVDQTSDGFTAELVRNKDSDARYVLNWSVIDRINPKRKTARTTPKL